MAKVQIELTDEAYEIGREIAFKNKLNGSKVSISELLHLVAIEVYKYLDNEDFEELTGFKK